MTVRNDPDERTDSPEQNRPPRPARPGREPLLDRAADLLAATTLEQVLGGTVGVRQVAAAAGVAPATVNHHFPGNSGRHNVRLAIASLERALMRAGLPVTEATAKAAIDAADDLRSGEAEALRRLAYLAADDLIGFDPEEQCRDTVSEAETVALLLAAAVAPRSPTAADSLMEYYGSIQTVVGDMFQGLLDATDRRLVADLDVRDLACVLVALADGFMVRRRFDPERMTARLFAETVLRVFESFTALLTEPQDRDPTDQLLPPPQGSHLDPHKRGAIVDAANAIYDRDGWAGVTIASVAEEAGVSRPTVVANFRDRGGLSAAVFARFIPSLNAGVADDVAADRSMVVVMRRHLVRLSELVREHHQLTGALIESILSYSVAHGALRTEDPADPRMLVPLPGPIMKLIRGNADLFRPGYADSTLAAFDTALTLSSQTLHLAVTRANLNPEQVAHRVVDTTLAGMLRRRPTG
jgi:AcrR family transcriptional regulator